jgi:hypothetical protein
MLLLMLFFRATPALAIATITFYSTMGCADRGYTAVSEPGPHGAVGTHKVGHAADQAQPKSKTTHPAETSDPSLAEIEAAWPKLSPEQRAAIVNVVRQMPPAKN